MLQKVLQLYASNSLSKRTYAMKGLFIVSGVPYTQSLYLNRLLFACGSMTLVMYRVMLSSFFSAYFKHLIEQEKNWEIGRVGK